MLHQQNRNVLVSLAKMCRHCAQPCAQLNPNSSYAYYTQSCFSYLAQCWSCTKSWSYSITLISLDIKSELVTENF